VSPARPRPVTGERVVTSEGGFNPTWQRHVAAYRLCAGLLPPGRVLDLGCGVGHSYRELAPRETVGVDIDPGALEGQARETRVADMRALPFDAGSFDSVLAVQSLEHVPDPERVLAEARRVLTPAGTAVFVTPNRLTFGPADEIVDPYHYVEFAPPELRALCEAAFAEVELRGIAGSARYQALVAAERRTLDRMLRLDPLRLRRAAPRALRQALYDRMLARRRGRSDPVAELIEPGDFTLVETGLERALDLVAACRSQPEP
jgi:SAM-dependent methyltransferase